MGSYFSFFQDAFFGILRGKRGGGLSAEIQGTLEDSLPDSLTDSWSTAKDSWLFFGNGNKEMNIGSSRQWSHFK